MEFILETVTSVLCFVAFLMTCLYLYGINTFNYWKDRGVTYIKPLPFIGTSRNLILRKNNLAVELDSVYNRYKNERFVGTFAFRTPSLLLRDPVLINDVLTSDFTHFHDRGFASSEKINPLSANLLNLAGAKWKNLRKKLSPVFTSGKLKTMTDELEACAEDLVTFLEEKLADCREIEMRQVMAQFTTKVIGSIAFGCKLDTLNDSNSEFLKNGQQIFRVSFRSVLSIFFTSISPKLRDFLGFKSMRKDVEDFYLNFVKQSVAYREKNNFQRNDFLQLLINLRKEDASGASKYLENSYTGNGSKGNNAEVKPSKNTAVMEQNRVYKSFPGERFVGIYNFRVPTLVVRDPELINDIMTSNFTNFHDRDVKMDEKINPLTANLASLTGTKWKNLRRKLTPVFTSGKLKTMMEEIVGCAEELVNFLDEKATEGDLIDVREVMSQFTTNVIGSVAFGVQLNTLKDPNSEFIRKGKQVFRVSYRRVISFFLGSISPKLRSFIGFRSVNKEVTDFYLNFVKKSVAFREENNIQRNDYLQLLINLRKEEASGASKYVQNSGGAGNGIEKEQQEGEEKQMILDDTLMAANVFIFFIAGFETTASTLSNCLLELAANPDVQQKLREEVLTAMKNNDKLNFDVVKDMKYMEQVISETLRKYSVAISLNRVCTQKYKIPGTDIVIDEGVKVSIPIYSIHKDPQYYPDPEKFDPERFSEENKKNRQNGTYLPFGDGPRICIGLRFALLEMKVALAHVLSRYQFSMSNKMAYPLEFSKSSFLLAPKDGIWLKVSKI